MASVFVLLEAFNRKEAAALGFFPCATASSVIRLSLPKGAAAVHFSVVFSPQKGYNNLKFCIA